MTSDADRFWGRVASKLRRAQGFSMPTEEEAEAELEAAKEEPLREDRIDAMLKAAVSEELAPYAPEPDLSWLGVWIVEIEVLKQQRDEARAALAASEGRAKRLEEVIQAACMRMGIMLGPLHPDQQPLRRDELASGMDAVYTRLKVALAEPAADAGGGLTDEQEAEAQRLHRELCEDIAAGKQWGLKPAADAGGGVATPRSPSA